jgi:hypothetical protein
MAELAEAFTKLNNTGNKLFCFISKIPLNRVTETLEQNKETSDYEWKDVSNNEYIETLNIELPQSTEIHWELFSDQGYTDKGKMFIDNKSLNTRRYLTFNIDSSTLGKNFFINLKCSKYTNNSNREIVEDIYDNYNCFINLDKLIADHQESSVESA